MAPDVSTLMAQMLANARLQQAPGQSRPAIMGGGGPAGASFGSSTNVGANIDIGAIQRFFSAGDKEKEEQVNKMYGAWLQQKEMDPNIADQAITNPFAQQRMKEGYEKGDNRIIEYNASLPDPEDPQNVIEKPMYRFNAIALPEQSQKEVTLAKMNPEERKKELKGNTTEQDILSTRKGSEEERKKLLSAMAYLRSVGQPKGEGDKVDPRIRDAKNNFAKLFESINKPGDLARAKVPEAMFADTIALLNGAKTVAGTSRSVTGSSKDAMGEIASVTGVLAKRMEDPKVKPEEKVEYIRQYTDLVKVSKPDTFDPYVTLMDWAIKTTGGKRTTVNNMFKVEFGADDKQIEDIYRLTKDWAKIKVEMEAQQQTPPGQPEQVEQPKSFGGVMKEGAKSTYETAVKPWVDWWKDVDPVTKLMNKVKGKEEKKETKKVEK